MAADGRARSMAQYLSLTEASSRCFKGRCERYDDGQGSVCRGTWLHPRGMQPWRWHHHRCWKDVSYPGSWPPSWKWQSPRGLCPTARELRKMAAGCGGGSAAIPAGGEGDPSSVGQPYGSFQPLAAAGRFARLLRTAAGVSWEVVRERRKQPVCDRDTAKTDCL